jgi:hypothetical protein
MCRVESEIGNCNHTAHAGCSEGAMLSTTGWDVAKHEVLCQYWGTVGVVVFIALFLIICNSFILVYTCCFISDNRGSRNR